MSDNNGWPDPTRPGVPMNPERDGWHWVVRGDFYSLALWHRGHFTFQDTTAWPEEFSQLDMAYVGPALTPAEVDARVAVALNPERWRGAINDALTNWLSTIEDHETPKDALQRLIRLEVMAALDPAVSQSAADLVAKARRDAREEAARLARHYATIVPMHGSLKCDIYEAAAQAATEVAASIEALSDTPSGMVLVPREPTDAMIKACLQAALDFMAETKTTEVHPGQTYPSPSESARRYWRAMVKAAEKGESNE